jgi:uncharacterized protein YndB with AHSA1/START domain
MEPNGSMYDLTQAALVAAPPAIVWRDWTDAEALAAWLWPARFETSATIDPVEGGAWTVRSAPMGMAVVAEVVAVDPPRGLRLAWRWEGDDHGTDVSVGLEPAADDATRVTVTHTGFPTASERDEHIQGWTDCLDRLIALHGEA